jgi:hypothetical protein
MAKSTHTNDKDFSAFAYGASAIAKNCKPTRMP